MYTSIEKLVLIATLFVAFPSISLSETHKDCGTTTIEDCPSHFIEKCKSDTEFSKEFPLLCLKAVTETIADKDFCEDTKPCPTTVCSDDPNQHPLKAFYCENNSPECPVKIQTFKKGFEDILADLTGTLEPYDDLIALDLTRLEDVDTLCEYKTNQVDDLRERASQDIQRDLNTKTKKLGSLRQCNVLVGKFMKTPRKQNLSEALWQNMTTMYAQLLKDVSVKEGTVKSKIEDLQSVPQKIRELGFAHEMMCDEEETG